MHVSGFSRMNNRPKIIRPNFSIMDGLVFGFEMTDHLDPEQSQDQILEEICETIADAYELEVPIWAKLSGGYIFPIPSTHRLFQYLDLPSRRNNQGGNWLVFKRQGNDITVTHFGPFAKNFQNFYENTMDALKKWKELRDALKSKSPETAKMTEEEIKEEEVEIDEAIADFWSTVSDIKLEINSKQEELKKILDCVYSDPIDRATAEELKEKLTASTREVAVKGIATAVLIEVVEETMKRIIVKIAEVIAAKGALKEVGKAVAKEAGKATEKAAGKAAVKAGAKAVDKATAKAVPSLGAVVRAGFGVWRLCHEDVASAGLEFASEEATCSPGPGTAASFVTDADLVRKDMYEATTESNQDGEVK